MSTYKVKIVIEEHPADDEPFTLASFCAEAGTFDTLDEAEACQSSLLEAIKSKESEVTK